ncbi:MAG TPA: twin-arginine translocation signal domain-containing protein, partial [bacterium]|nr:twin-arginine translocation signal domain-containing protein [bacterium]
MSNKPEEHRSRREFLKYSAAIAGGAGVLGMGVTRVTAAADPPQGEVDLENLRLVEYDPEPQLVTKESYVPRSRYTAIDVHNHLRRIVDQGPQFIENYVRKMDECNVQAIVDLDGRWGETLDRHMEVLKNPYPDRFYIYARVDWSRINEPDFSERAVEELERGFEKGVQGLK